MWFTNNGNNSIGRITTSGTVTNYTGTGISGPNAIAAGPDGALWFTNDLNNSIGRITTSGTVTNYTGTGIGEPYGIADGTDGALWFTNLGNDSIGRITTTDEVLAFGNQSGAAKVVFGVYTEGFWNTATGYFTNYQAGWPTPSTKATLQTASVTCVMTDGTTATITGTVTSGTNTETVVAQAVGGAKVLRFSYAPNITQVTPGCDTPLEGPVPITSGDIEVSAPTPPTNEVLAFGNQSASATGVFGIYTSGTGKTATGYFTNYQAGWPTPSTKATLRTATVTCVTIAGTSATITGKVTSGTSTETVVAQAMAGSEQLRFSYAPNITKVSKGCDTPTHGPVPIASGDIRIGT